MWTASDFGWGEYTQPTTRLPVQTGKMTREKLTALVAAGYGQGHFQRYKPWLRVTKRDYSPSSVVGHLPGATLGRLHHFRSIAERRTIQLCKWLGAVDVREQLPLWPWEHPHHGVGLPGYDTVGRAPALLDLAKDAGIDHGRFVGTDIPYVATLDMLTTWQVNQDEFVLLAIDNKPDEIVYAPSVLAREKERLELTRRYKRIVSTSYRIVDAAKLPSELMANLDMLEPQLNLQQQAAVLESALYRKMVDAMLVSAYEISAEVALQRLVRQHSSSTKEVHALFHLALWRQDLDHDLALPLKMNEPLRIGGRARKAAMKVQWVGEHV